MSDRAKLRETLERLPAISGTATDRHSLPADRLLTIATAARDYLALLESDAIVIKRDSEGKWPVTKGLQDLLEDMFCIRLQKHSIHERGRCVTLASVAVELFNERLDALAESSKDGET